jgi:8-oxo-dGTP pyrophosphatase MutT (NUDIX family)
VETPKIRHSVVLAGILQFHAAGQWRPHQVHQISVPSSRRIVPEIESLIESAWQQTLARPGVHLFDGPMCRLESWDASPDQLTLSISPTSYKPFLGTNLAHPELFDRFGRDVLANPVGVSPALLTADCFVMMGRRNSSVAYYPNRIHPFAGALDPNDPSIFAAVERELAEELSLSPADLIDIACTGIAEDLSIHQPELIFSAKTKLTRAQIESRLDRTEHHDSWAAPVDQIDHVIRERNDDFTPVALAAMALLL